MEATEMLRRELWQSIRQLKRQRTLPAIRQARQMLRDWMQQHPDDVASQDAGEELAMMEDALEVIQKEHASQPVAA
ncbi:MAG: hypothetical protein JO250_16080 [Armatimonadetes bacterium]|nr:hypothetical protein [Armatimonadota bacterium]